MQHERSAGEEQHVASWYQDSAVAENYILDCCDLPSAAEQYSIGLDLLPSNQPRFEFRQQFDKCTPAFDPLVAGDVSAHGARIGFCRRHGKPVA